MPAVLLRPSILTVKNRLLCGRNDHPTAGQTLGVAMAAALIVLCTYYLTHSFLTHARQEPELAAMLPAKIINLSLLAFFFLLLFSNIVGALGQLFAAQDLPMLLTAPASHGQLYLSRLILTVANSSGVFLLFTVPALLAYMTALDLPWWFLVSGVVLGVPFMFIPGALGCIFATLVVSLIPAHRIKELFAVAAVAAVCLLFTYGDSIPTLVGNEPKGMSDAVLWVAMLENPSPNWSPTRWASDAMVHLMEGSPAKAAIPSLLLTATAIGLTCFGYLLFTFLFKRGWTLTITSRKTLRVDNSAFAESFYSLLFPFSPRTRAFVLKDARLFVRDTTQTLQMLLLLLLTLVYLYNFKALRGVSNFTSEGYAWWQSVLAIANLALGTCVVAAICTRFVFPSVSLEGRAYWLIRNAPLSIRDFIWFKYLVMAVPISAVSLILIVSGAFATQLPISGVLCSGFLAIVLGAGTVGLATGMGAFFARFDWNSPTQIAASIGSLVYMFFALALVFISLIPASLMIILTSVQSFAEQFSTADMALVLCCAGLLTAYINIAAARQALCAGAMNLERLER